MFHFDASPNLKKSSTNRIFLKKMRITYWKENNSLINFFLKITLPMISFNDLRNKTSAEKNNVQFNLL